MKKNNVKKGILFWITGLSGSGKSSIAKTIKPQIEKYYGSTLMINGDELRKIFEPNGYDYKSRLEIGKKYCKFAKFVTDQNINVIFAVIGMFHKLRKWNKENVENYFEVYIKSNITKIKINRMKKLYFNKKYKSIIGIHIKPELPKNPNITISNNFDKTINELSKNLLKKIL